LRGIRDAGGITGGAGMADGTEGGVVGTAGTARPWRRGASDRGLGQYIAVCLPAFSLETVHRD